MFSILLHRRARVFSSVAPLKEGPRHCGQLAVCVSAAAVNAKIRNTQVHFTVSVSLGEFDARGNAAGRGHCHRPGHDTCLSSSPNRTTAATPVASGCGGWARGGVILRGQEGKPFSRRACPPCDVAHYAIFAAGKPARYTVRFFATIRYFARVQDRLDTIK